MNEHQCPPNDDPEMVGCRARNLDGQLRAKRGDTLVRTIEAEYGVDLGMRGDARLDTALDRYGVDSLTALLRKVRG
jgi:hypothetical protein